MLAQGTSDRRGRVAVVVLATLLLGLGVLQWRWTGELASAERERRIERARRVAEDVAAGIDREVSRALLAFFPNPVESETAPEVLWQEWTSRAPWPEIVVDLWRITGLRSEAGVAAARVERSTPQAPAWVATGLAPELEPARERLSSPVRRSSSPILADVPAVVVPRLGGRGGSFRGRGHRRFERSGETGPSVLVIRFDPRVLTETLLSELAEASGVDDLVVGLDDGSGTSRWVGGAERAGPDEILARVPALGLAHPRDLGRLARDGWGREGWLREALRRRREPPPPRSPGPDGPGVPPDELPFGRGWVSGFFDAARAPGPWTLMVASRGGSLEEVVASTRRRNMGVGLAVLALLAATMGFLLAGARRSRDLARQRLDLVAGITHDLRTPIAAVSSLADNLADGLVGEEDVPRYGAAVGREARRLRDLVEQGLALAGLESVARVEKELVDLRHVAEVARESAIADLEEDVEVRIDVPSGLSAVADRALLRRALVNLLVNAARHGAGPIVVSGRRCGGDVEMVVEDSGPGLGPEDVERLFEPFARGERARRSTIPGSGLGLAVVRRVADVHGGHVSAGDREGGGARFALRWPVGREASVASVGGRGR